MGYSVEANLAVEGKIGQGETQAYELEYVSSTNYQIGGPLPDLTFRKTTLLEPQACVAEAPMRFVLGGYPAPYHPQIRGQCVAK